MTRSQSLRKSMTVMSRSRQSLPCSQPLGEDGADFLALGRCAGRVWRSQAEVLQSYWTRFRSTQRSSGISCESELHKGRSQWKGLKAMDKNNKRKLKLVKKLLVRVMTELILMLLALLGLSVGITLVLWRHC